MDLTLKQLLDERDLLRAQLNAALDKIERLQADQMKANALTQPASEGTDGR